MPTRDMNKWVRLLIGVVIVIVLIVCAFVVFSEVPPGGLEQ